MPKSLKFYLIGVVAAGAAALAVATLFYEPLPQIALRLPGAVGDPTTAEIVLGAAFWTILTLVGSSLPVQFPRGTQQAVAIAPIMTSIFLGGPAVAVWVAALGTTE